MEKCIRKIRDAGLVAGGYVAAGPDDFIRMIDMGMQLITYLPDVTLLHRACCDAVRDFKEILEKRRGIL